MPTDVSQGAADRAVQRLAAALASQDWIESLPEAERPATLDEAYRRQDLLTRALGYQRFGWKVAALSARALRQSADGRATFGQLWHERRYDSGVDLSLPRALPLTIEVEIAVRFVREARPAYEPFEAAMIDACFVAFELVRSRFVDKQVAGHLSFVSDNAGFHSFVLGEQIAASFDDPVLLQPATLLHDNTPVANQSQGENRNELGVSLAQFWGHMARQGIVVPAGAIVTTGSQTAPLDVRAPGRYEGRIAGRTVRMTLA